MNKISNTIWETVKVVGLAILIVVPIRYFLFQPFFVQGQSMEPNLETGDYLIIDEISYRFNNPTRGDIVVLKYPSDPSQRFIKRIIGLPEETIDIADGKIVVTKGGTTKQLDESAYILLPFGTTGSVHVTLKDNEYFVMGDNRAVSFDSRRWGPLPRNMIIGRAFFRAWPFVVFDRVDPFK
ncbi:MAG: signal peptidase I [bacterium]